MQIPVFVEPVGSGQFRAQVISPLTAVADGATSDEALSKLRDEVKKQIKGGKRLVMLEVNGKEENPWLAIAGSLKDNPLFDEWQEAIREYRRERDIEDGIETDGRS